MQELSIVPSHTRFSSSEELVRAIQSASENFEVVIQAFDPEAIISEKHLLLSFFHAFKAFGERANISNSVGNEALLRAAATRKFDVAVKKVGVKDPEKVLLAITTKDGKRVEKILCELKAVKDESVFQNSPEKEEKLVKLFEIPSSALEKYSLEELILEKVALAFLD